MCLSLEEAVGSAPCASILVFRLKSIYMYCMLLSVSKSTEHAGNSEFCCNPVVFSIIIPLPSLRPIRVVCSERRRKTRELAWIELYTLAKLQRIVKRWKSQRKKIHRLAYRFSIDFKIYRLAYGFLCVNHKGLSKVYRFSVRAFFSQDFKNP